MVNILFINPVTPPNIVRVRVSMGVASLSAILKREGHKTALLCPSKFDNSISEKIKSFKPDLIAVSTVSDQFDLAKEIIKSIKHIPVIMGGIHATVATDECIKIPGVIGVCIGEGDEALPEFLRKYGNRKDYTDTKNFWFKENGKIIKNPLRPLIQNLDALPFPDREIFEEHIPKENLILEFMASRGCPFQCNYCINKVLQGFYGIKGYLRRRSVDNLLKEINQVLAEYKLKHNRFPKRLEFHDDLFTADKAWLKEFADKYKQQVNQPYAVNARIETIDEETVLLLKESGCVELKLGIESGNERIRKEMLNRHMTNHQIISCFSLCKKRNLPTSSFNMIGIPGETEKEIEDTINLNRIVKPSVVGVSVFRPYQGTYLYDYCKKNGYLTDRKVNSFYEGESIINLPTISKEKINYYYQIFQTAVYHPNLLPLVTFLVNLHLYKPMMRFYYFVRRNLAKLR